MNSIATPAGQTGFAGSAPIPDAPPPRISRNMLIAGGVVAFHVAALWALQTGLLRRAVEMVVPVEILSQMVTPPAPPKVEPPPPAPPPPQPKPQPVVKKAPTPPPAPQPVAIADPTPAPAAPTGVVEPQPPAPPVAAPVAPPAPPAPPRVELPSSDADYLQNPKPTYPAMSRRLREEGTVIVRVMIGADGQPQRAELKKSSGFERLDRDAIAYVMKCRYKPGTVNGVAQAMWKDAPVVYTLTLE